MLLLLLLLLLLAMLLLMLLLRRRRRRRRRRLLLLTVTMDASALHQRGRRLGDYSVQRNWITEKDVQFCAAKLQQHARDL